MSRTIDINYGSSNNILLTGSWNFHSGPNLSNLVVGSTFKLGKYQVESETPWPIEWEIVHQESDYQIAMTKQIIDCIPFDAKEPTNPNSDRKNYGNNNWQYSNIEQWLNSDQASWYSAQHSYDAPPNSANVSDNAYDTHKGFLYHWSADDKALLKDMTLTLANNTVTDGGGSYTWTGKVFLPTYTQMGFGNTNNISEGIKFSKFTDNASRIKTINKYCIDNNKTEGTNWYYWMSSGHPSYSCYVRIVDIGGSVIYLTAYSGDYGLAPCICLPRTSTTIENTPEEEFSNTSITNIDRATKYHNGNAFYFSTTDAYGKLTYRWFRINDSTKIGTSDWANGVSEFTATESVLDWNSISGRPTTLEEFGITNDLYTKTQVNEKFNSYKTKATELSEKVKELDGTVAYEFSTSSVDITNIGLQIRKDSTTFADLKTGTIPQIDVIIKTSNNKIYKTTQNLNSEYEDINGNKTTTVNASEPLGASMSEVYFPDNTTTGETYYTARFATDYANMTDNPNYNTSGCGISVTATAEEQVLSIKDPADESKELCKLVYSNKRIKFIYSKASMVNNVVNVGIGSTEKLDILNTNFEALRSVAEESDLMKYVVRLNIDGCKFTVNSGNYNVDVDITIEAQ